MNINGRRVYAYTGARPFDPALDAIVFVHGAGMDHTVWLSQCRYFAHHGYAAVALDLPGHGRSDEPACADVAAMADVVVEVLDALACERASLVGHSMGALVVLEAAARVPQRIDRLALLGAAVPMAVADELLAAARANDHAALDMITLWGHGPRAALGGNQVPGIWLTGSGRRLLERARPGVLFADLTACDDYDHGPASAAAVRCPTLLLLGERDLMTPVRCASDLARAISQSETVILRDCGHMLMAEKPNEVLDRLMAFFGLNR